jgi:hypothetical protein
MIVVLGTTEAGRVARCANICAIHPRLTSTGFLTLALALFGTGAGGAAGGPVVAFDRCDDVVS